jgi:hypothetical protein
MLDVARLTFPIIFQGLLPTLMLAYVGLDLGVNTDRITN